MMLLRVVCRNSKLKAGKSAPYIFTEPSESYNACFFWSVVSIVASSTCLVAKAGCNGACVSEAVDNIQ